MNKPQAVTVITLICGLVSHMIGRSTMNIQKLSHSVHGFLRCSVNTCKRILTRL